MNEEFRQVYQFRIDLRDTRPPIWRRIQVPETYNFHDLHVAIQNVMGWSGEHLHEFYVRDPFTGRKIELERPEWETNISDWLKPGNPRASYVYDFGDWWEHNILLEKILPRKADVKYPVCIKGKRACPPEDSEDFGWSEGESDPEHFDPKEVVFDDPDEYLEDEIRLKEELGLL
ncbi:MAG: plasmid pRiA4b ORF-3 family protein [Euryarchaeota archaeon]|nr:plasmid pRiA4b ORF-3 family protein [Euryarchaeota archaeon]